MNKYLKGSLLAILTVFLILITAPFFGWLYSIFIDKITGSWIGTEDIWKIIVGLFFSYAFFIPFIISLFYRKHKYYLIIFLIILELLFFWGFWQGFVVVLFVAVSGSVFGELILFSYKKLKK